MFSEPCHCRMIIHVLACYRRICTASGGISSWPAGQPGRRQVLRELGTGGATAAFLGLLAAHHQLLCSTSKETHMKFRLSGHGRCRDGHVDALAEWRHSMTFRLSVMVVASAATALAVSCSSQSSNAPTSSSSATIPLLTAGIIEKSSYSTLDPNKTYGCNADYCSLFYEHLLMFGPNGKLEPELATSFAQTSPVTYVYHLRHGVKFWDGKVMTSADVVHSLEYSASPASDDIVFFTNVKSIQASGPYTVVITLKKPDADWRNTLSYEGPIFEKSFQQSHPTTFGNPGVLTEATGPWKIDSFDPTTGLELSANPHWWGGRVNIQHITYKFYVSETSEALAMRAGEIDVAFPSSENFAATSGAKLTGWPSNDITVFGMNVRQVPWNDVHVRRAVAYALNRADIIAAYGGPASASPIYTLIPQVDLATIGAQSQVSTLLSSINVYPYSLAKARQEMSESAYPRGFTAATYIDNVQPDPNINQVIAAELQKIGITLKIKTVIPNEYYNLESPTKNVGAMFSSWGAVSPDPSQYPSYLLGSQREGNGVFNYALYSPPPVDQLLSAGLSTSSSAARLSIYGQLLKQLATDVPYIPLYQSDGFTALSSKFTLPKLQTGQAFIPWALEIKQAP